MMLWWGLIVLAVVWFAREVGVGRGSMRSASTTDVDPAVQVLRERYARGEIDTEEFGRRMAGLD
jgi:putative membrane protein